MSLEMQSELHRACFEGNLAAAQELSSSAIDINWGDPDRDGWTGLLIACFQGNKEIVRLLLDHPQIEVNKAEHLERTPLWFACLNGREEVVEILMGDGRIAVNRPRNDGWTPLDIACQYGKEGTVKILLAHPQIDASRVNKVGRTPLWGACYMGNEGTVKILLASGREVDPSRKGFYDGKEYSPAEIARKDPIKVRKGDQIARLLEEFVRNPQEVRVRLRKELQTKLAKYFDINDLSWCCQTIPIDFENDPSKVKELVLENCFSKWIQVERTQMGFLYSSKVFESKKIIDNEKLQRIIDKIENFVNLEKLNLNWNDLSSFPWRILEKFKNLKELGLVGAKGLNLIEFARSLNKTNVKSLDLSSSQFQNQETIREFVAQTKKVEILSFLDSNLDETGALGIIQAILKNGRNSFKEIKIDSTLKLKSFAELETIPKEIKEKAVAETLQYALDLTAWKPYKEEI